MKENFNIYYNTNSEKIKRNCTGNKKCRIDKIKFMNLFKMTIEKIGY